MKTKSGALKKCSLRADTFKVKKQTENLKNLYNKWLETGKIPDFDENYLPFTDKHCIIQENSDKIMSIPAINGLYLTAIQDFLRAGMFYSDLYYEIALQIL